MVSRFFEQAYLSQCGELPLLPQSSHLTPPTRIKMTTVVQSGTYKAFLHHAGMS